MGEHQDNLSAVILAVKDGYEKGYNSPNNIKKVFILKNYVGVQYHLGVGSKKINFKQVSSEYDGNLATLLGCLISPKVCSSIEEIIISGSITTNLASVTDILVKGNVVLMNRFPRLRGITITTEELDYNEDVLNEVISSLGALDKEFETMQNYLKSNDFVLVAYETKNQNWYDKTYFRKYLYTFDEKIQVLFDKIHNLLVNKYRTEKLNQIDENVSTQNVNQLFIDNKQIVINLYNKSAELFKSNENEYIKYCKSFMTGLKNVGTSQILVPSNYKKLDEPFLGLSKFWESLIEPDLQSVTEIEVAKKVLINTSNFIKYLELKSGSNASTIRDYLVVLDNLMCDMVNLRLKQRNVEKFLYDIQNEKGEKVEHWIDPKKVLGLVSNAKTNSFKILNDFEELKVRYDNFRKFLSIDGFVQTDRFEAKLSVYTECLQSLHEFIQNYDNWDMNLSLQEHFYKALIREGYIVLQNEDTKQFVRPLSKPIKKPDYILDVKDKHRNTLESEMERERYFYVNPDFENDGGAGYDEHSLKILYKESDASTEFFFLMPVAGSKYSELSGQAGESFHHDLGSAFYKLENRLGIRFTSIHSISTVASAPVNCIRVMTLKDDVMQLNYLLSDLMDKKGVFASEYLKDTVFGDLSRLLVGIAPNGAIYADTKSSGSWSFTYGGGNGSGKTVATWSAIAQLIMNGCPLITVDAKNEAAQVTNSLGFIGFGNEVGNFKIYNKKGELVEESVPYYYIGLRFQEAYFKYYKEKALRDFIEKTGTGDTIKGVDSYIKEYKNNGVLDLTYTVFFVDEIEAMLNDKKFTNRMLSTLQTIGSMARTAGVWRFYATQSPKAGQLGQLVTNMNHFILGAKLSRTIVTNSLQLTYDDEIYSKIDAGFETTGVKVLNKQNKCQGLFGFYPTKTSNPMLIKSIYFKESENERQFKEFLNKYMPQGYQKALRVLNATIDGMVQSGYLRNNGYEDVLDYLEKIWYDGKVQSGDSFNFDSQYKNNGQNTEFNLNSGQQESIDKINELNTFSGFNEFNESEFGEEVIENDGTFEKNQTINDKTSNNSDRDFRQGNYVNQNGNSLHEQKNYDKMLNDRFDLAECVGNYSKKLDTIPVTLNLQSTLVGSKLNKLSRRFINSDLYYAQVFKEITELLIREIRDVVGGLERVFDFELNEGVIVVNGNVINPQVEGYEAINNRLILRHIENGTLGELFDLSYLKKFKRLNQVILSNFEYAHKVQVDLKITNWSEMFNRLPSVVRVVVAGNVINRKSTEDEYGERYKHDQKTYEKSKQYVETASKQNKKVTPSKSGFIRNFYKNERIPNAVKIVATGGTVVASALVGTYLGALAVPLLVLGLTIKSALKGR